MNLFPLVALALLLPACTDPQSGANNRQQEVAPAPPVLVGEADAVATPEGNLGQDIKAGNNEGNAAARAKARESAMIGAEGKDQCGASKLQSLLGKPRSSIPASAKGPGTRVTCTSCAMTMDYSPSRLNILYDEKTNLIAEIRCG